MNNFNFGEVLTRSLQITWKHKTLWAIMVLPMLLAFLMFPLMLGFMFLLDGNTSETTNVIFVTIMAIFIFMLSIASIVLGTTATSSVTLGIVRAERGEGSLNFMNLLRDSLPYFWRSLGAVLIIQLSIGLVFTVFFLLVFVLTLVTMGMASICFQPIMILLSPIMFLIMGVIEAAQTAIIVEDLGSMGAIKRGIQVVREHIWKYVIITLIIYLGTTILMSFITFPMMLPMFFIPFVMDSGAEISRQIMMVFPFAFMCIFFPVMALISGITQTFMKVSLDLTYLQLTTKPKEDAPVFIEANG